MIEIEFIAADGSRRKVAATPGRSVMQAAVDAGIDGIVAECGGTLTCATCHVHVQPPWSSNGSLPAPSADEDAMLDMTAAPREADSRLSCQLVVTPGLHGLTLRLPPTQY
jgi:2Fe-2S ferredoxin